MRVQQLKQHTVYTPFQMRQHFCADYSELSLALASMRSTSFSPYLRFYLSIWRGREWITCTLQFSKAQCLLRRHSLHGLFFFSFLCVFRPVVRDAVPADRLCTFTTNYCSLVEKYNRMQVILNIITEILARCCCILASECNFKPVHNVHVLYALPFFYHPGSSLVRL